ncbi:hypothetical protein Ahy_A02g007467 [Arachis hypogaea]|uniref:DNA replication factor Dna2 N-terminal domain-containing protein n=1 Tax=Arachis hypogaea TaxID=3818 RepID=A0A445ECJ1_ARAHY|nr:hypothetical protein Ahy_A02g007467 [Arachis hypogaea]
MKEVETNKLYQLLSNNPVAFCLLVAWVNLTQHMLQLARVAAEEDVAKNSKDLFEQFDDSRQQKNVLGSSRKLGQTGQNSNSNDVKVGNKKHAPMKKQTPTFWDKDDKVDELLTSPTPKTSAKALPSMSKLGLKRINPEQSVDFDTNPITLSYSEVVAGSFGCLRRTILDERLKCNEYSTAALTRTLLHQIFQAGLTEDNPSIDFLEGYTEVVLLRNIESLYACGVKCLISFTLFVSWLNVMTDDMEFWQENEDPNVCFGFHNRPNKVTISEASSNLTDSFYPLVWILEELNKSPGERENIEWILEELNNFNSTKNPSKNPSVITDGKSVDRKSVGKFVVFGKWMENLQKKNPSVTAKIPEMMGDMKSLESFDVSNNQLSGTISNSMSAITSLSHLNLSHNNLSVIVQLKFLVLDDLMKKMTSEYLALQLGFRELLGVLFLKKNLRHSCFKRVKDVAD